MKKKHYIIGVCVLLAIALAITGLYAAGLFKKVPVSADKPNTVEINQISDLSLSDIKILPIKSDSGGIDTASGFRLLCSETINEEILETSLKITPEQPFTLKKETKGEYLMNFSSPLKSNSIYRFEMKNEATGKNRSWAFQTKQTFNVSRTLPRNEAIQVPIDSGIEITFSSENVENIESYFEITPAVPGSFEFHRKTAVFVPKSLEYGTIYTVKIKKGLGFKGSDEKLAADYSFSFQTVAKNNSSDGRDYFSFAETNYNFTPQNAPALQVYASDDILSLTANVEVFKYPDENKYLEDLKKYDDIPFWAVANYQNTPYDTTGMVSVAAFPSKLAKHENNYWYTTYMVFPSQLPEGHYLAKITFNKKDYYVQLQVSSLSVYIMLANNQTLAWVNDSSTGKPVAGATLSGDGIKQSVKTSNEGVAAIDTSSSKNTETRNYYFSISGTKNPVFVAKVNSRNYYPYTNYYGSSQTDDYWTYLYLDKSLYLPDDTINLWGLVKPRDSRAKNSDLTLELVRNDYSWNENGNDAVIEAQQAKLSPNGTFSSSFHLAGFNPGSYIINVKNDGKLITSSYFQVLEYTKPAYKIDLTPSSKVVYGWEKVNMNIQASFFEGSPLPGLELSYSFNMGYSSNGGNNEGKLTCNDNGSASLVLSPTSNVNSWRPQYLYFNVNNANAEEEEINAGSNIMVFPRDTMLEISSDISGNNCEANITTSKIDIRKMKEKGNWSYSEDEYRGSAVDTNVEVKLFEKYWVARETGEYYDFISKKKVKKYEYNEEQKLLKQYQVKTLNGKANIEFNTEKEKNYYLEARYVDSAGRDTVETQYIYNWSFSPYDKYGYSISTDNNKYNYKTGETVSLHVKQEGNNVAPSINGKFLYVNLKNGIMSTGISPDSAYSFRYNSEYVPNMYVKAVYFDGVYMHDAGISDLRYDFQEKKLDIAVTPDKTAYKPGDTVKLEVDVKDIAGKPCKAEVNISAIDEAFFAVMDQYVDTLSGIYNPSISSGLIADYISYRSPDERGNPMAEGGEGGDSLALRKDFKDSAFFGSVTTNGSGHAEFSFKLPDNLTSWRITYQALTDDLKAGSGKTSISGKLPYFVDTIFNKIFMTGDSPSLLLRSFGTELKSTDIVDYSISIDNNKGSVKSYTAQSKSNITAAVPIGKLEEGNYTVTVKGKTGGLNDGIQKSFTVAPELLTAARVDYSTLSEDIKLPSSKSLTTLSFLNKDSSALYNELLSLYWTWGERLDQQLSRKISGEMLKKYYNDEFVSNENIDLSGYQTSDGGLALLTYDSSNAELSAKICALAKDNIDTYSLASYFYSILNNKNAAAADVAYSYWGLASLEKPVLTDIQNILGTSSASLGLEEKLIFGIALAYIGDYDGAEKIYSEVMADKGKTEGEFSYINAGSSRDEISKATALCSILALRLNQPEKQRLFNYAKTNSTSELLTNLERLIYITSYIPGVNQESSFSYELDGKKQSVVLKNDEKHTLVLTPDKLGEIKFSDIKGNVSVVSSYTGHVKDLSAVSKSLVGINRSYTINGASASGFNRSELIKIVLTPSFVEECPDGFYEVTDILPAGFRYVSARPDDREGWYPDEVSGQKVTFGLRYDKNSKKNKSMVYYARAVSPGTYTADSAFIKHSESNVYGFSGKQEIIIK